MHFYYVILGLLFASQSFVFGMEQENTPPTPKSNSKTVRFLKQGSPLNLNSIRDELDRIKSKRIPLPANQIPMEGDQDQPNQ